MEELVRAQKYDELAEYLEEEELKVCQVGGTACADGAPRLNIGTLQ